MEGEGARRCAGRTGADEAGGAQVWAQLAYCLDISNVARNALAMPLVLADD